MKFDFNISEFDPNHLFGTPPDIPNIEPLPFLPNQEKQIELMVEMVNKQSEMINKQSELISLIRNEANEASKQSKLALTLTIIGLIVGFIQTLPTLIEWIKLLL